MGTIGRGVRNVLRNPIRLVLVAVLLGASLMFAAAMVALDVGIKERLADVRSSLGTDIEIRPAGSFGPMGAGTISDEDARRASRVSGVVDVEKQLTQEYTGKELKGSVEMPEGAVAVTPSGAPSGDGTIPPLVTGVTPGASRVSLMGGAIVKMVSGRGFSESDANAEVALMSKALAEANGLGVGSKIDVGGTAVEIVGLYETGQDFGDNSFLLPIETMRRLYGLEGVSSLTVSVGDGTQAGRVADRLRDVLGDGVDVVSQEEQFAGTFQTLESAQRNVRGALIAALVTSAVVIAFAVFLIVRERTREIGVLKALGAANRHVVGQFAVEVMALASIAAVAATVFLAVAGPAIAGGFDASDDPAAAGPGVEVAAPGGAPKEAPGTAPVSLEMGGPSALGDAEPLTAGLTVETLLVVLGLGVALAVISSAIPAWYVARVKPAEVLRGAGT